MFDYTSAEITAGAFVLVGLAILGYLSVSIGGLKLLPEDTYRVTARFSNVGDLKPRAPVKVAGVRIGKVRSIPGRCSIVWRRWSRMATTNGWRSP